MNLKIGQYKLPKLKHSRKKSGKKEKKKIQSCGKISSGLTHVHLKSQWEKQNSIEERTEKQWPQCSIINGTHQIRDPRA